MVRRPWLRRTRLLAGAPTESASVKEATSGRLRPLGGDFVATRLPRSLDVVDFAAAVRPGFFVTGAGSPCPLGDPMPGEW
jgi:hypothetical protein